MGKIFNFKCVSVITMSLILIMGASPCAGEVTANHIAKWDGNDWSALGGGMDGSVTAIAFDKSGNLYAGGTFVSAGGVTANSIAKWDGNNWSALGTGMDFWVFALAFDERGTCKMFRDPKLFS